MDSEKVRNSIFVHCITLNIQALKFDFGAFCAFLRPYQNCQSEVSLIISSCSSVLVNLPFSGTGDTAPEIDGKSGRAAGLPFSG